MEQSKTPLERSPENHSEYSSSNTKEQVGRWSIARNIFSPISKAIKKHIEKCSTILIGYETYRFRDGSRYSGNWKYGQKHGKGTLELANGDKYEVNLKMVK